MDVIHIFAILCAAYAFLCAVYVVVFGGERYMKWYLRNARVGNCDLKRFKIIHVSFLCIGAVCLLLIGLNVKPYIPLVILFVSIVLQRYLIDKFGKKLE